MIIQKRTVSKHIRHCNTPYISLSMQRGQLRLKCGVHITIRNLRDRLVNMSGGNLIGLNIRSELISKLAVHLLNISGKEHDVN